MVAGLVCVPRYGLPGPIWGASQWIRCGPDRGARSWRRDRISPVACPGCSCHWRLFGARSAHCSRRNRKHRHLHCTFVVQKGDPLIMKHALFFAIALTGCSALTGQQAQDTQQAVDTAAGLCSNTLLRSDTPRMLLDSGVLPEAVPAVVDTACAVLAASKPGIDALLQQAVQQRTTPARMLELEARRRGLL